LSSASGDVNVGSGNDISELDLAMLIARVVDFNEEILTDPSNPDGAPRKLLETSILQSLGWQPKIGLESMGPRKQTIAS
jgi:GDP-L-fucose synthase